MSLQVVPISIKRGQAWVATWHRKLPVIQGGLFAIGCADGERFCGVAIVRNPSRMAQDGWTAEIVRVATDGTRNACSFLISRARRAAQLLGYRRLLTKTLPIEGGASLRAVGAKQLGLTRDEEWGRGARPRQPSKQRGQKIRWEVMSSSRQRTEGER